MVIILLKKVVSSLVFAVTMILLCSTYSYAETNDSNMRTDLEENLTNFEESLSSQREHYNLEYNDIISNNLELGEIYQNNNINIDANTENKELSKKLKKTDQYISTVKLKDSNKPIALAYIKKEV